MQANSNAPKLAGEALQDEASLSAKVAADVIGPGDQRCREWAKIALELFRGQHAEQHLDKAETAFDHLALLGAQQHKHVFDDLCSQRFGDLRPKLRVR